jgi:hypothetical protein
LLRRWLAVSILARLAPHDERENHRLSERLHQRLLRDVFRFSWRPQRRKSRTIERPAMTNGQLAKGVRIAVAGAFDKLAVRHISTRHVRPETVEKTTV